MISTSPERARCTGHLLAITRIRSTCSLRQGLRAASAARRSARSVPCRPARSPPPPRAAPTSQSLRSAYISTVIAVHEARLSASSSLRRRAGVRCHPLLGARRRSACGGPRSGCARSPCGAWPLTFRSRRPCRAPRTAPGSRLVGEARHREQQVGGTVDVAEQRRVPPAPPARRGQRSAAPHGAGRPARRRAAPTARAAGDHELGRQLDLRPCRRRSPARAASPCRR